MTVREFAKKEPGSLLGRAWEFAKKAHEGQKRKTGEPYFTHPAAVAEILWSWKVDDETVAAGLLHDTVEDTSVTLDDVRREFGEDIAFLVDGVTKLGKIKYRGAQEKVENLRKLIIKLSQDLRVVFVKLADRLHNMRTLTALPPAKQKRIALETDEIYAPLAYRLGMQSISGELHDLCFPYLHPSEERWLRNTAAGPYEERLKYLERIRPIVAETLARHNITPLAIDFRAKRFASLYKKLLRNKMNIDQIYDLVAMRLIVKSTEECYAALGVIHAAWPPLPGRIKDYIAMPKPNGYRSLHTTIIGPEKKIIEFQIRTQDMHSENENGIAAHWIYEQNKIAKGRDRVSDSEAAREVKWVEQLKDWQNLFANENPEEFLSAVKTDFFKDRIFVMTPIGEVIDLPAGSTPIDFAYRIHSGLGDTCAGAKINGQFVPLDHELRSGDMVEVLSQKNKKPSEDWLLFAKTASAKDHIRQALKKKKGALDRPTPPKTELRIVVVSRVGILKDISTIIARSHINISSINQQESPGSSFAIVKILYGVTDKAKTEKIILKLKELKEIKEVSYKLV